MELYFEGKSSDKEHRFQPQIIAKYRKTIDILGSIAAIEDLCKFHSLRYEALTGNKVGLESARVNDQYCILCDTSDFITFVLSLFKHKPEQTIKK